MKNEWIPLEVNINLITDLFFDNFEKTCSDFRKAFADSIVGCNSWRTPIIQNSKEEMDRVYSDAIDAIRYSMYSLLQMKSGDWIGNAHYGVDYGLSSCESVKIISDGHNWYVDDSKNGNFSASMLKNETKCECGARSVGSSKHSSYCEIKE